MTTPSHPSARPVARSVNHAGRERHRQAGQQHPCRPASAHQADPDTHEHTSPARAEARDAPPRTAEHALTADAPGHHQEPLPHRRAADPPDSAAAPRDEFGNDTADRTAPAHGEQLFPHLPPGIRPLAYTPEQAAVLLAVRASWLRRAASAGEIACTYLGKHLRFSDADLHAIIADNAAGPRPD
ncbi:MAG TPA: helix-turn-helix domain-containing protein [Actinospica sp.]|nr:helix-turn-helix domain-containing protein [Actinospica sp.]